MRNVIAVSFLASFMLLGFVHAEDNEKTEKPTAARSDEPSAQTIVYLARNAPADSLSAAVAVFLEGTNSHVTSEATSNVLLIRTSEENQQRVIALLQQLDRAPRTLRIQMHLLKAQGKSLDEVDTASLTGQTDEVRKSIKQLESTGRVRVANRIELAAVENQLTFLQVGEDVSLLAGATTLPGRGATTSYRSVAVGTILTVQARLSGESVIVLEVDFEKSEIEQPSAAADKESTPAPQGVSRMTHQTTSRIQDGHSLLVGTLVSQSSDGVGEAYLVLSASIDNSEHPKAIATLQSNSPKPTPKTQLGRADRASDAASLDDRYRTYAARLLAKYDKNNDKSLDTEEQSSMSGSYSDADTDENGLLTLEELASWMMKR